MWERSLPKGETQLSPEKKLVLAIFGEKAGEVKDSSLRVPSGVTGTIIDTQIYCREGVERSERLKAIIRDKEARLIKDLQIKKNAIQNNALDEVKELLLGQKTSDVLLSDDGSEKLLEKGRKIKEEDIKNIPFELLAYIPLEREEISRKVTEMTDKAENQDRGVGGHLQGSCGATGQGG